MGFDMKKLCSAGLIAFFIVTGPAVVFGGPFLVSDPVANCDPAEGCRFEVFENGVKFAEAPAQANGSMRIDLQGIAPGAHTVTARAVNMWGASAMSDPFGFSASVPGKISDIGLSE